MIEPDLAVKPRMREPASALGLSAALFPLVLAQGRFPAGHDAVEGLVQGVGGADDGLVQDAGGADDGLDAAGQRITLPVPVAQSRLTDVIRDRLRGVPGEGFTERHVRVVAVGRAAVVGAQRREHVAVAVGVAVGVEDAFDHDVESGVQGVAGGQVDQAGVRRSRPVVLAQHGAAKVVLADQGQAAAEPFTQDGRDGRLPRGAVAAQDGQPGFLGTHHHGPHATDGRGRRVPPGRPGVAGRSPPSPGSCLSVQRSRIQLGGFVRDSAAARSGTGPWAGQPHRGPLPEHRLAARTTASGSDLGVSGGRP